MLEFAIAILGLLSLGLCGSVVYSCFVVLNHGMMVYVDNEETVDQFGRELSE